MKRLYIILIAVIVAVSATGVYAYNVNKNISEKIIRLHILGNSNNIFDQEIKYKIRDKVIESYNFEGSNRDEQYNYLKENLGNIKSDVDKWLMELGVDYQCSVTLTEDVFPTKEYANLKLPYGKYTALKIILGNGDGKNWWCVMFPPMCFTEGVAGLIDPESDKYLKENLSASDYNLITGDKIEIRFKTVELFNKLFN
ncbi:MAG: stage II sporulation protein R [Clostridia bacterium]|nr:stage II sporulation protein R [Clostridia bacterium]